jgi:AraC-like DNA-binding protein
MPGIMKIVRDSGRIDPGMDRLNSVLLWYLFIFLLFGALLLLFFIPIHFYVSDFIIQNELGYMEDKLEGGIAIIDAAISAMNNLIVSSGRDSRFQPIKLNRSALTENPYAIRELRESFNSTLLSHTVIADAGILLSEDLVITRTRVFYGSALVPLYDRFLRCGDLSLEEWKALLQGNRPFIPVQSYETMDYSSYQALTFAAAWANPNSSLESIFYATLPVREIIPLVADGATAERARIRIYDNRQRLLYAQGETSGNSYTLERQNATGSLIFEVDVPETLISEKIQSVNKRIFLFGLITILLTIVLTLAFSWKVSKPMRNLLANIETTKNIRTELEKHGQNKDPGVFRWIRGFMRIYTDLGESLKVVDTKLEYSLKVLERETRLLRVQIEKIRDALDRANDTESCTLLRECTASLPEPEDPMLAGLIDSMLTAVIGELKGKYSGLEILNAPIYMPGNQKEIFEKGYPAFFRELCKAIGHFKAKEITDFGRQILDYIQEQLYNPELYITMVSDRFKVSPPTIQKLCKTFFGETFQVYVEKSRLEKAMTMLVTEKHTIVETAVLCGFANTNSFYKSWRRRYGSSPSETLHLNPKVIE